MCILQMMYMHVQAPMYAHMGVQVPVSVTLYLFFVVVVFVFFFKTGFLCVGLGILKLTL